MIDENTIDEATLTVMKCEFVWNARKIPAPKRAEMREELTGHLTVVLNEGGTATSVVGPDTSAFAEEWGEPYRPANLRWLKALDGLKYSATAAMGVLVAGHLRHRSPAFPYDARKVGTDVARSAVTGAATEMLIRVRAREEAPGLRFSEPLWKDALARFAGAVAPWLALLLVNATVGSGHRALSEWSWRSTVVVFAAGMFLLWKLREDYEPGLYSKLREDFERRLGEPRTETR